MMNRDEWDDLCFNAKGIMAAHVVPYVTPISRSEDPEAGYLWGTGNYVQLAGRPQVLTNHHVVNVPSGTILAHLPKDGDNYVALGGRTCGFDAPYDFAACAINPFPHGSDRALITAEQFDQRFDAVPMELLFWIGYPGTSGGRHDMATEANTRRSFFGHLPANATPILSQQPQSWPSTLRQAVEPGHHVVVEYPREARRGVSSEPTELPSPHGMSGSLLWDTKRVACLRNGTDWTPRRARVCGIIWASVSSPDLVAATKIEHVHAEMGTVGLAFE